MGRDAPVPCIVVTLAEGEYLPTKKPVALIVEDDSSLRHVTGRIAESAGFELLEASNAESALRLTRSQFPRVVISDILLPDFDGYELCRRIKTIPELSKIPVILIISMFYVTDHEEAEKAKGKKKAASAGAHALLPRGEALDALAPMLRQFLTRRQAGKK